MMFSDYATRSNFTPERRAKPRIDCSFLAVVRGRDLRGKRFQAKAVLVNLSARGLYLQLDQPVVENQRVFVVMRLSDVAQVGVPIAQIAMSGLIVRSDPQSDGRCGLAIKLEKHRFI